MSGLSSRFELFVDDKQKSVDFYTSVLNFTVESTSERYISLKRDNVTIGISSYHTLRDGHYFLPEVNEQRKGLGVEIVLESDDIVSDYSKVTKSGYQIYESLVKREWGLTDFRITDPDGYYLRLTSKH